MRPFVRLSGEFLPSEARRTLLNRVRSRHFVDVVDHISTSGAPDGLSFLPTATVERLIPEALNKLRRTCPLPFTPHVFVFRPGASIAPHVDGRSVRQCAIAVPLWPHDHEYTPTLFWRDGFVTDQLRYGDLPALMNLQALHSVGASQCHRVNFQLSFATPYDEARVALEPWHPTFGEDLCE